MSHAFSCLFLDGRTDPVLDDVGQAFRLLGVSLSELEDYVHNLEPVGFAQQTPLFPLSKNNVLQFPQPGVGVRWDAEERKDYIPDYMPPLVSLQEGKTVALCVFVLHNLPLWRTVVHGECCEIGSDGESMLLFLCVYGVLSNR
jgi:hypothetical protein